MWKLTQDVRLIPPDYVKPLVKCQKNDTSDAEATRKAAGKVTLHFLAVNS